MITLTNHPIFGCHWKEINFYEKNTLGRLGTAHIAEGQTIPGMQNTKNCELYAIAGRSLEKAKEFQNRFHFKKAYGSYDELLEDPEVEAVYIPLPNHLHKEWVLKAAAHKKHILCEKPMSGSAKDTRNDPGM